MEKFTYTKNEIDYKLRQIFYSKGFSFVSLKNGNYNLVGNFFDVRFDDVSKELCLSKIGYEMRFCKKCGLVRIKPTFEFDSNYCYTCCSEN